jgi:hypothetical protein
VVQFFLDNETWLRRVLEQGLTEGTIGIGGSTQDTARAIVANLEGAMLVARPFHDIDRFQTAASATIAGLRPPNVSAVGLDAKGRSSANTDHQRARRRRTSP